MPRRARAIEGGLVYHILNRGNARATLFEKAGDYEAFERVLEEALLRTPPRFHLILDITVSTRHRCV